MSGILKLNYSGEPSPKNWVSICSSCQKKSRLVKFPILVALSLLYRFLYNRYKFFYAVKFIDFSKNKCQNIQLLKKNPNNYKTKP